MNHEGWKHLEELMTEAKKAVSTDITVNDVEDGGARLAAIGLRLKDIGGRLLGSAEVAAYRQDRIRGMADTVEE